MGVKSRTKQARTRQLYEMATKALEWADINATAALTLAAQVERGECSPDSEDFKVFKANMTEVAKRVATNRALLAAMSASKGGK